MKLYKRGENELQKLEKLLHTIIEEIHTIKVKRIEN